MTVSFVFAYARLVAQHSRQRRAGEVFLLATIWKYGIFTRDTVHFVLTHFQSITQGCIHSLDWTTGLIHFWFLHMLWLV